MKKLLFILFASAAVCVNAQNIRMAQIRDWTDTSAYLKSLITAGGGFTDTSHLSTRINLKVDSINKKNGTDSVFYFTNGTRYFAYIDSKGAGSPNTNIGSGYRWAIPGTNNIKTVFGTQGFIVDSTSNANALTFKADTAYLNALYGGGDTASLSIPIDSTGQSAGKIIFTKAGYKLTSSNSFLYSDSLKKMVIGSLNVSVGGPAIKLYVVGKGQITGDLTAASLITNSYNSFPKLIYPATPASGRVYFGFNTNNNLFYKNENGYLRIFKNRFPGDDSTYYPYKSVSTLADSADVWTAINTKLSSYTETDPVYTSNGVPKARIISINGTAYDLSADRSWTISGGSSSFSGLSDVNITSIADGQLIKYNAATSKYINFTPSYATLSGTETLTNKTLTAPQLNSPLLNTSSTAGYVWTATNTSGAGSWQASSGGGSGWSLIGNSGTTSGTNFIGTSDNQSFKFRTNNVQRMIIDSVGKIAIGAPSNGYYLYVKGGDDNEFMIDNGSTTYTSMYFGHGGTPEGQFFLKHPNYFGIGGATSGIGLSLLWGSGTTGWFMNGTTGHIYVGNSTTTDNGYGVEYGGTVKIDNTITTNGLITASNSATSNRTTTVSDEYIPCDAGITGAFTLTLLSTAFKGQTYEIQKLDNSANAITISAGAGTIVGTGYSSSTYSLPTQYNVVRLKAQGSNIWTILSKN